MKKLVYRAAAAVAALAVPTLALAQEHAEAAAAPVTGGAPISLIPVGVGLTLGLAAFGGAFGQGRAAASALEGIARNPAAAAKIQIPLIVSLALMEGLTIFSWLVASGMAGKI